jgi:hypothetical protein
MAYILPYYTDYVNFGNLSDDDHWLTRECECEEKMRLVDRGSLPGEQGNANAAQGCLGLALIQLPLDFPGEQPQTVLPPEG